MNRLVYGHLSDDAKRQICNWKYDGEYAIYNLPAYEEMKAQNRGFMDSSIEKSYYGFWDNDVLVGYVKLTEGDTCVSIGIGVNPDLCERKYGQNILSAAYNISKSLYNKPLDLIVRSWNIRAIKCYEKAGFCIDGLPFEIETGIGIGTFYRMVKE